MSEDKRPNCKSCSIPGTTGTAGPSPGVPVKLGDGNCNECRKVAERLAEPTVVIETTTVIEQPNILPLGPRHCDGCQSVYSGSALKEQLCNKHKDEVVEFIRATPEKQVHFVPETREFVWIERVNESKDDKMPVPSGGDNNVAYRFGYLPSMERGYYPFSLGQFLKLAILRAKYRAEGIPLEDQRED